MCLFQYIYGHTVRSIRTPNIRKSRFFFQNGVHFEYFLLEFLRKCINLVRCYVGKPQYLLRAAITIQPHQMMNINSKWLKNEISLGSHFV